MERLADRLVMDTGIRWAYTSQATEAGKKNAVEVGVPAEEVENLDARDFIIAAEGEDSARTLRAIKALESAANASRSRESEYYYTNVETACAADRELNLACVGVDPQWAERVCNQCLDAEMNLLISSSMEFEEEIRIKKRASEMGLMVLGAGVHGALIGGVPLGYCPPLRSGNVALIGQSFTACLEAAFTLEWMGLGVRHLLPTGRRDCFTEGEGISTRCCIEAAAADPETESIALILKAGDLNVLQEMTEIARNTGKKVYVYGLGSLKSGGFFESTGGYDTLATMCSAIVTDAGRKELVLMDDVEAEAMAEPSRRKLQERQQFIRGFFLSETTASEITAQIQDELGPVYSNRPVRFVNLLKETRFLKGNTVLDYGSISSNPTVRASFCSSVRRNRRMTVESYNRSVALLLADWIGGAGCDRVYLDDLAASISECRRIAAADGRELPVAVIVYNCRGSAVDTNEVISVLNDAGAEVFLNTDDCSLFIKHLLLRKEA